jgi:hypothetical protein
MDVAVALVAATRVVGSTSAVVTFICASLPLCARKSHDDRYATLHTSHTTALWGPRDNVAEARRPAFYAPDNNDDGGIYGDDGGGDPVEKRPQHAVFGTAPRFAYLDDNDDDVDNVDNNFNNTGGGSALKPLPCDLSTLGVDELHSELRKLNEGRDGVALFDDGGGGDGSFGADRPTHSFAKATRWPKFSKRGLQQKIVDDLNAR